MTMILHKGATYVDRAALAALPAPVSLGPRHNPIPHTEVVETLRDACPSFGLEIARERYGLSPDGHRLFGLLDFTSPHPDRSIALGFRTSTDESFAVRGVAGSSVFVCDNLALSGSDFVFHRKHTTFRSIINVIRHGLERFLGAAAEWDAFQLRMETTGLDNPHAAELLIRLMLDNVLPARRVADAARLYFGPTEDLPDVAPRTVWGVHNAVTRTLRDVSPETQMHQSSATTAWMARKLLAA